MRICPVSAFRNNHRGETVFLLGNGPSLARFNKETLRSFVGMGGTLGTNVIGMNASYTETWSRYHCFLSSEIWDDLCARKLTPQVVFTLAKFVDVPDSAKKAEDLECTIVPVKHLPTHPWMLRKRFSPWLDKGTEATFTGIFALQIAVWLGFKNVYLVGYDSHDQEGHHHDDRKAPRAQMLGYFGAVQVWCRQNGVNVYNCNPDSAIRVFPFKEF